MKKNNNNETEKVSKPEFKKAKSEISGLLTFGFQFAHFLKSPVQPRPFNKHTITTEFVKKNGPLYRVSVYWAPVLR